MSLRYPKGKDGLSPKDYPLCKGCGERMHPSQLVEGFCRSGRYSAPIPKDTCVRIAAENDPLQYGQMLASLVAAKRAIQNGWESRRQEQRARAERAKEVA